jgi:hypothetical protein
MRRKSSKRGRPTTKSSRHEPPKVTPEKRACRAEARRLAQALGLNYKKPRR